MLGENGISLVKENYTALLRLLLILSTFLVLQLEPFPSFFSKALLASQQPSYELRHNQIESLFLSGIDMYGNQMSSDSFQVQLKFFSYKILTYA